MPYFATFPFDQNFDGYKDQFFKLICILIFCFSSIGLSAQIVPQEFVVCKSLLISQQSEAALRCLEANRPVRLSPSSPLSIAWLELWLEAESKQANIHASKQSKIAIDLAIEWLGSPQVGVQSKKRLSYWVYQHLNAQPKDSVLTSMKTLILHPQKDHLLLAFMVLVSFCTIIALFILSRYYFNGKNYFRSPKQEQKVLQQYLKERNQTLIQQYSQLQDYSIANSHLVRAPLARLLGLVELMKDEPLTRDGKFYMQNIAQSCEELDDWVMKMNTILDPSSNNTDEVARISSLNHFLSMEK